MATRPTDPQAQHTDRTRATRPPRRERARFTTYIGGKPPLAAVALFAIALLVAPVAATLPGDTAGTWLPTAQITQANPHADLSSSPTDFGAAVAIDGDTMAVGSPWEQAVHVYEREALAWSDTATLTGPAGFGQTLALSGDRLAVGAPWASEVLVYERGDDGWALEATVTVDAATCLGAALALEGGLLAAGDPCGTDATYLVHRGSAGWGVLDQLSVQEDGLFGRALAMDGGTLVVSGLSLYAYDVAAAAAGGPNLVSQEVVVSEQAGAAVALSDGMAATGHRGQVLIFEEQADAGAWTQVGAVGPGDLSPFLRSGDRFGFSLAAGSGTLVVGAYRADLALADPAGVGVPRLVPSPCISQAGFGACASQTPGAVYVYEELETGWAQTAKLTGLPTSGEAFGIAVAIDPEATEVAVGAPGQPAAFSGLVELQDAVYFYERLSPEGLP